MTDSFQLIRAAAVDERAHNIFYRQTQLEKLCKVLIARAYAIQKAIAADYGHSAAEVATELDLTISSVKSDYASLQPKKAHEEEYSLVEDQDAPFARRPAGIVYIEPTTHTLFYSVVVPLSASIAAGNCNIVLLENNLRAVSSLLRDVLSSALDQETFAIASTPISDPTLLELAIVVRQTSSERWPKMNELSSPATTRAVAVVDRTANVQHAAKELVAARFSFRARSPYAPDIVLVNEFAKEAFLEAVVSESIKYGRSLDGSTKGRFECNGLIEESIARLRQADSGLRVVVQEDEHAVVEVLKRKSELFAQKTNAPVLLVHAVRSLDDAIDLSSTSDGPNVAAYHFGNPATGKYLTQFVDASVSFVNNVPRELLVGPAYPATRPVVLSARYSPKHFSMPRPAYTRVSPLSATLATAMTSNSQSAVQQLLAEATKPFAVIKRSPGGSVGFFEQGFLINAALILTAALSITSVGAYWLARHDRPFW